MKKLGLLDRLAEQHRTFISNLRLQPTLKWEALGDLYGYNCYFVFDGDSKSHENSKIFDKIITVDSWETDADKYVMTNEYAYFGADFEKYFRTVIAEIVDQYAISYGNVERYPNPAIRASQKGIPQISVPSMEWKSI